MSDTPEYFRGSAALQLIQSRGWKYEVADSIRIRVAECPWCGSHSRSGFIIEIHGTDSEQRGRDGIFCCHHCGKTGNLSTIQEQLGVTPTRSMVAGVGTTGKKQDTLIDFEAAHQALLEDADAMDYLTNGRGFSREIIEQQKIGFVPKRWFREAGEVRALVFPYLVNGNCVFWQYRTLPTMPLSKNKVPKEFNSPSGWDATLYNSEVLREGVKEVTFVEGASNTIAALDHGVVDVCGVPGANFKKAEWITSLDKIDSLERIYVCYDKDKAGQRAGQEIASRVGIERCWKIVLPDFKFIDPETGEEKQGKDLNEWFVYGGGTVEAFEELKKSAVQFDVLGVASAKDAVQELQELILGRGVTAKYKSPWRSLNKLVGFDEGDVIDIVAPEKIGKTTFGLDIMEYMVDAYGDDGIIICLEMTTAKLARKWVCHVTGLADNIPQTPEEAEQLKDLFLKAIPRAYHRAANRPGNLYFCYPRYTTVEDIYNLIRDCYRRYGVKWVMLDNLQRLADSTPHPKINRTEHLSQISKKLSQIAKDCNIQLIRILQPHRIREGDIISTDDVDGASQVAKDCDCMLTLHRNRVGTLKQTDFDSAGYVESAASFDDKMLVNVGLSRYSSGGYVTLHYDGARSTVEEYDIAKIAMMKAEATKGVGYEVQLKKMNLMSSPATPVPEEAPAPIGEAITV
jgi:twinkle protein